jgi:hypothetical protein
LSEHGYNVALFDSGVALLVAGILATPFASSLTSICMTNLA